MGATTNASRCGSSGRSAWQWSATGDGHVEAHDIKGPEGRALGTADEGARQLVDLIDAQAQLLGQGERALQAVDAQPVGDEGGRVLGPHRALAEVARRVLLERLDDMATRSPRSG